MNGGAEGMARNGQKISNATCATYMRTFCDPVLQALPMLQAAGLDHQKNGGSSVWPLPGQNQVSAPAANRFLNRIGQGAPRFFVGVPRFTWDEGLHRGSVVQ